MSRFIALSLALLLISGCANRRTTDVPLEDSGQAHKVKFGTVIAERPISIRSENTGAMAGGALIGGSAGAIVWQSNGGMLAGLIAGGLAGTLAHRIAETENGIEYTIALSDGTTILLAQIQGQNEPVHAAGSVVMVQFGAKMNRVLAADHLPAQIKPIQKAQVAGVTPPRFGVRSCDKGLLGRSTRESCTEH
jgi:outer membrane lipoprotein SlyB